MIASSFPLFLAMACWCLVSYVDAATKARYMVWAREHGIQWDSWSFMADRGTRGWRIDVLFVLSLFLLALGALWQGGRFVVHFVSLFPIEHWAYWQWVVILKIPQEQQFGGTWRHPRLGESPDDPSWLRIGGVSLVWLHRRFVLVVLVVLNIVLEVWIWHNTF